MRLSYPLKDTRLKQFLNAAGHYRINESPSPELNDLQKGGWFPIGMNDFWHAGVHFDGDRPIHAVADGQIVAYRVTNNYIRPSDLIQTFEGAKKKNRTFIDFPISNNFVLTKHLFKPPEGESFSFYLLYMHLLPHQELSDDQKKSLSIFHQHPVSVKRFDKPDGAGLQLVDGYHLREIIVMPKGSVVEKLDNNRLPDEIFKRGYSRVRAHVYNTTFTGYADLNNDRHLKQLGDRYLIDTTIHPNPEKTGLNVRKYPIYSSAVVDVAPFGAMIRFDGSAGEITDENGHLKSFSKPERYKKIKGYRYNGIEYNIEGYIYAHSTYLETKRRYDPEIDVVKCPNDLTIEKGDVLGWSGRDGTSDKKKTIHVELFIKTKKDLDALKTYTGDQLKNNTDLNKAELLNLDEAGILSEKEITQAYIRTDFMCDVSGLVKKSSNGGNEIVKMGIEEAVADEEVAPKLRKMVAKHPPEWLPIDKDEKIKERLMEPPYMWPQEKYDAYKELYFEKLAFWDQLNGFPDECYYFHPIKFIEHIKLLEPKIKIETVNKKGKKIPYPKVYQLYDDQGQLIHKGNLKNGNSVFSDLSLDHQKDYYIWDNEKIGEKVVIYNGELYREIEINKDVWLSVLYKALDIHDLDRRIQEDYENKVNSKAGPGGNRCVQMHRDLAKENDIDPWDVIWEGDLFYIPLRKVKTKGTEQENEKSTDKHAKIYKEDDLEMWYMVATEALAVPYSVGFGGFGDTEGVLYTEVNFICPTRKHPESGEKGVVIKADYTAEITETKKIHDLTIGALTFSLITGNMPIPKNWEILRVLKSYEGKSDVKTWSIASLSKGSFVSTHPDNETGKKWKGDFVSVTASPLMAIKAAKDVLSVADVVSKHTAPVSFVDVVIDYTLMENSGSIDKLNRDQYFGGYFSPDNISYRVNLGAYKEGIYDKPPEKKWPQRPFADVTDTSLGRTLLEHFNEPDWILKRSKDLQSYFSKDRFKERIENAKEGLKEYFSKEQVNNRLKDAINSR